MAYISSMTYKKTSQILACSNARRQLSRCHQIQNKVYKTYVAVIYWPNIVSMAHKKSSQILSCSNAKSQLLQGHKRQKQYTKTYVAVKY